MSDFLFGRVLASKDEEHQRVGVLGGIPILGLDGLASAAYGPEAALTILIPLGVAGIAYSAPILGIIVAILLILYFSYRQTMAAYPNGGGSYAVAKRNLGTVFGLTAAAALFIDYILVAAVGISAGVGALVSAIPSLHPYILDLGLVLLIIITLVNLRGVKESGLAFALPTYLFVASLGAVIIIGIVKSLIAGGQPIALDTPAAIPPSTVPVTLWLLMRAFASGCTAMTGVEAVSNGMSAFAEPRVKNAQKTLAAIVAVLVLFLIGIAYLASSYKIGALSPESSSYESIVSQLTAAVVGRGVFYYIVIGATLAVLALSANTGFADFPRLCRLLAKDDYLPHVFANRGRRLVYSLGISIFALLTGLILIAFGGITDRLIPLFAVGAFLAFTLSQAGMVVHWFRVRGDRWRFSAFVNGMGAVATGVALVIVLVAKFTDGAWITALLIPAGLMLFVGVKRHYNHVTAETRVSPNWDIGEIVPPLVIVPIKAFDTISVKALRFASSISPNVHVIHVFNDNDERESESVCLRWTGSVMASFEKQGVAVPTFEVVTSPYRRLLHPLIAHINELARQHPNRTIAVVLPELVEAQWWQYLLHNQRATALKAALLFQGGPRIVVINVPWYLGAENRPL